MSIRIASSDEEILACYPIMAQLRPHVGPEQFLPRVRYQQEQGYHLAFLEAEQRPITVAGFRLLEQLFAGRVLYVDDLVTDARQRSGGYGARMLSWLREEAMRRGCQSLDLDSGTHRTEAHRFYEREGMTLSSYHFKLPTQDSSQS